MNLQTAVQFMDPRLIKHPSTVLKIHDYTVILNVLEFLSLCLILFLARKISAKVTTAYPVW